MNNNFFKFSFLALIATLFLGSCDNDVDNNSDRAVQWFTNPDTTLNAEEHTFIVDLEPISAALPNDWRMNGISEDDFQRPGGGSWCEVPYEIDTDDVQSIGWIRAEKVPGDKCPRLKITVKANEGEIRAARIGICSGKFGNRDMAEYFVTQEPASENGPFKVKIRYKNRVYTANATEQEDGTMVYDDPEFNSVLELLGTKENVETVITGGEGIIDYFDEEDLNHNPSLAKMLKPVEESENISLYPVKTRTSVWNDQFPNYDENALAFTQMFDDTNFKDTSIFSNIYEPHLCFDVIYLKDRGLNDKISSLIVIYNGDDPEMCAVLTLWEDSFFNNGDDDRTKHKINYVASYSNRTAFSVNLKSVPCINSSNSWNDRISSCSFHMGHFGSYPKEY